VQWPSPTPDGRYDYFHSTVNSGADRQLKRIELATGAIDDVTQPGARFLACCGRPAYPLRLGEVAPEVSPDGRWLAFARKNPGARTSVGGVPYVGRTTLWLRDLTTGVERMVMDPIANDAMDQHPAWEHRVLPGYGWAADGKSLVMSQGGQLRRLWVETGRVETIPFTARVRREISEMARSRIRIDDSAFTARSIRWAAPAPGGKRLVFEAVGRLWLKDLPSGVPAALADIPDAGRQMMPAWSPDGRWIAFTTWSDSTGGAVWRVPANGGAPIRFRSVPTHHLYPAWSDDGAAVLVNRWDPALSYSPHAMGWEVVRLPLDGGAAQAVRRAGPLSRGNGAWEFRMRGSKLTAVRARTEDPRTHPSPVP
jgi:dipeptidyl aminopeptidase/acylaminoacyl peptidase